MGRIAAPKDNDWTSVRQALQALDKETTFLDEDDMASDSARYGASQQSIKAYIDAEISPNPMTGSADSIGEIQFGNGFQMKWGKKTNFNANETKVIDFTDEGLTDFNNACFQGFATYVTANQSEGVAVTTFTTTSISVNNGGQNGTDIRWFAIGY
jgi:hypothetical protein